MAENKTESSRKRGRQPDASSKSGQIRELLKDGLSAGEIAKKLGCTPALVYNVKARMGGAPKAGRRGPGRPPKAAAAKSAPVAIAAASSLDSIVAAVRQSEQQRAQLRTALERIQSILADALR